MANKSTQNVYSYKQYKLTECPKFLYEVSLYKIWKDKDVEKRMCLVRSAQ